MEFEKLEKLVGSDWAHFLKGFMCPDAKGYCPFDEIAARTKNNYGDTSKRVFPTLSELWDPFRQTPLEDVRVVMMGKEPYIVENTATGLGISSCIKEYAKLPKSLQTLYDAVEKDVYNGLDIKKTSRIGYPGYPSDDGKSFRYWHKQGVLMLNVALTVEEKKPGSHLDLWRPFTLYIINELQKIKRNMIFIALGEEAKDLMDWKQIDENGNTEGVNVFHSFVITEKHPSEVLRAQAAAKGTDTKVEPFSTNLFSRTNLIIRSNKLGEPIIW